MNQIDIKPLSMALCLAFGLVSYSCTSKKASKTADKSSATQTEQAAEAVSANGLLTFEQSVAADNLSSEHLVLDFFRLSPRTAADLNLQGPVKSVRILTYAVRQDGDQYYKDSLLQGTANWFYFDKSYQYTFTKDGKCSPKQILDYKDQPVEHYVPSTEAKYSYKDGRITQIIRDIDGEDHWKVVFTYTSPTEVSYTEDQYESGRQVKETIANNIVVSTQENGSAEGDSWVKTNTYTYNAHKDIIKHTRTQKDTYLGAPNSPKTTKTVYTYKYHYDETGNWIGKLVLLNGDVQYYVSRTVSYY